MWVYSQVWLASLSSTLPFSPKPPSVFVQCGVGRGQLVRVTVQISAISAFVPYFQDQVLCVCMYLVAFTGILSSLHLVHTSTSFCSLLHLPSTMLVSCHDSMGF